ncbi:MAG TPA: J domain-containing protein, partial [Candidatus Limnocylindria bacterium]
MTDHDPYTILGVPRTAGRDEIARAYHRLAKQHHPDAGAQPSPQMALINEAWYTLSDPARRARWDQAHGAVVAPAHWAAAAATPYAQPAARPMPRPSAPPSRLDSGWVAAGVVAVVAVVVGVVMVGLSL